MTILFALFTVLAAVVHIFIFYLETIAWLSPRSQRIFGLSRAEALQTRGIAANQGVYNLLLSLVTLIGLGLFFWIDWTLGLALVFAGCGSMTLAALYLLLSSNKKQAALKQMTAPVLAVICGLILVVAS